MSTQETKLKDIADAIRAKEGSFDPIIANDFPARIAAIQTGTDTSDATATAGDILSGETAYVASGKVTGTIPTKTESNISVSGPTIIVPSGYYGSQVSKSIATATQATPTISVNSSGLITASSTQSAGYVTAGTKSATRQLTTQTGKTITPGRTQQTAVSSGRYTTGNVYVAGDTDLVAANIKKGINIFGVAGTLEGKNIIELQASDLLSNEPITRNSSKKITININANIPSNYELVYLHCYLRNAYDYEIENIIVNRYRLDYTGSILYYAAYVLANMSNNSEKECYSSTSFEDCITASRSSIVIDLTDLGRLSADFPSSPLEPFVFTAFYYPVSG